MHLLRRLKNSTASLFGTGNYCYSTFSNKTDDPQRHKFLFCMLGSISIFVLVFILILSWIGITYTSLTLYARISPCVAGSTPLTAATGENGNDPAVDDAADPTAWSKNRTVVWLQARWRTGSSVVAEALAQNPKVMYLFEPEHIIESLMIDGVISSGDQYQQWLEDFMVDLVQCRMQSRWFIWFMPQYAPTKWPHDVMPQHDTMLQLVFSDKYFPNISQRIQVFESYCKARPFMLIKTVRINLKSASRVLERLPEANFRANMRLITLWRDPRAIISSVFRIPRDIIRPETKPFGHWLVQFCADLADEYQFYADEFRQLSPKLPGSRYKHLFYEDFMQTPTKHLETLQNFSGIPRTSKLDDFIKTHFFVSNTTITSQSTVKNRWANNLAENNNTVAILPNDDDVSVSFSTIRSSLFDPEHWKKAAPMNLKRAWTSAPACQQAIHLFTHLYTNNSASRKT